MKALGIAALALTLAGPVAAQQTEQGGQTRQETGAGATQASPTTQTDRVMPTPQTDRGTPTPQTDRAMPNPAGAPQDQGAVTDQQRNRGAAGTTVQGGVTAGQTTAGQSDVAGRQNDSSELPATASPLAAIGILGLLSFAGAAIARKLRS